MVRKGLDLAINSLNVYIIKMKKEENDTTIGEVQNINNQFYYAFENLSIEMMERLWKHVDIAV